ncbi:LysR family transcriptional regulator, partial [Paraburkholderia sp. SIMBA_050]
VSHRIKNLEELWGDDLFVRSNAALRLTAAGTRYQRNVQDALKSLNELARPEYNKLRTRLRVAIPPTFGRQHRDERQRRDAQHQRGGRAQRTA